MDIVNLAHTTIVVDTPGMGDDIQSIKAGILEIADILVVNKADRPGADQSVRYLQTMIEMGYKSQTAAAGKHRSHAETEWLPENSTPLQEAYWIPPVLKTIAIESQGVEALRDSILEHANYLRRTNQWQVKDRAGLNQTIEKMISQALVDQWKSSLPKALIDEAVEAVVQRKTTPRAAVQKLLAYNNCNKSESSE